MQARFSTTSSLAAHHRRLMASCAESGCRQVRQMSGSGAKLSGRTVGESLCMSKSVAAHDTGLIVSASNLPTRCRQQCSLVVATVRGPSCDPTNTAIARTRCRPVGRCAAWCRILGWHPQRGPVPVHPGRVRHRCSSHGKLEPARPDTSRFTGLQAADGITAPAARTNPRAGIRPASGHRSEAPQREGSDGPSCHRLRSPTCSGNVRRSMDVTVRAPLLAATFWRSRRSAAIAGIILRVLLLVVMTMLRIAPLRRQPAITANRSAATYSHPAILHLVPFAGTAFLRFIGVVRAGIPPAGFCLSACDPLRPPAQPRQPSRTGQLRTHRPA